MARKGSSGHGRAPQTSKAGAVTAVRFRAKISRTGVQSYETGLEYRDAAEVFHPDSLASLDGVRVTRGHSDMTPVGRVVGGSASRVDKADPEGRSYLVATIEITDSATIADIRSGALKGISCGYDCEHHIDSRGDTRQINIRFDHVALLRTGIEQPRCGEHCAITQKDHMTTTRVSDSIQLDASAATACECQTDQAERSRLEGYLAGASKIWGVSRDAIVAAHPDVDATEQTITTAAQFAQRQLGLEPAQWHNSGQFSGRADSAAPGDLRDDSNFRKHLARKYDSEHTAPPKRGDAAGADLTDDQAFRSALASRGAL